MVIGGRIIQIIRLFSSLTVLSTDIVLISVILNAAESNADNAIKNQKTRRELACLVVYTIDQIIITSRLFELESCKLYDCFRYSLCCRMI